LFIFEQIYEEYNMGNKIRAAVIGYGNIGRYVIDALENSSDFEIAGIVRRDTTNIPGELQEFNVVSSIVNMEAVDVAILCTPTRSVEQFATDCLALGINTVDSFDIHGQILALRTALDALAKKNNAVSIIASGWDPGSDSVIRTLFEAMAPRGITWDILLP
jgi:diaminopimelate dehydrogenase